MEVGLSAIGAISGNLDDFLESRLEDGQRVGLPRCDAWLTQVNHGNADVRILFRDDGTCRAALHVLMSEGELRENNAW